MDRDLTGGVGPRQDEILSEMRHGLVQTNYRMSVKITWTMFSHTILSGLKQDNTTNQARSGQETTKNFLKESSSQI